MIIVSLTNSRADWGIHFSEAGFENFDHLRWDPGDMSQVPGKKWRRNGKIGVVRPGGGGETASSKYERAAKLQTDV
jgi:hypothetical protein